MARQGPLVSICIPAFHADEFLDETLRSVASQTFADWEVIVTEDGSKDETEAIVRAFAGSVSQPVIYSRHDRNLGLPATRNTGIGTARGSWIALLDSDDVWERDHLAQLVETAMRQEADLAFAGTVPFDDQNKVMHRPCVPTAEDLRQLPVALYTGRLSVLPSSVLVSRRAFEKFGLISTDFPHANDTEFWLRVLRGGGRMVYTGQSTCRYRKHAGAMSLRAWRILTNTAEICERYRDWNAIPMRVARRRVCSLYRYAARATASLDARSAVALMVRSLRVAPLSLFSWFYFVVMCLRAAPGFFAAPRRTSARALGA